MRRAIAALLLLLSPLAASADEPGRLEQLETRQRELEKKLEQLEKAAAVPREDDYATTRFLVVPRKAVGRADPDLSAPIAGYSWKNFFLRDRHSWFVLVPKGRINVDAFTFLNRPAAAPGVIPNSNADSQRASLRNQVFIKRARVGLAGTFARGIDFRVEGEFASLATGGQYATLADASVIVNYLRWLKLEAGQFYSPFTLENQTSENFTDFMEKSTVVRWAVPATRDTGGMLLGETPHATFRYWIGVFDGTGANFKNFDNRLAVELRGVIAPLGFWKGHADWMERLWVGGSLWWRQYENVALAQTPSTSAATAGDVAPLTTQGGFTVFNSNYNNGSDADKNPIRAHLAPQGITWKWALELNVPITPRYGLRAEYVHQKIDVHEYADVSSTGNPARTDGPYGRLEGWGAYVEAWAWIGGDINADHPGLYSLPHWNGYIKPRPPQWAILLAAKYEHVELDIGNLSPTNPAAGHYALDTFELGASLWVTRHARLMANYLANYVGAGEGIAKNELSNLYYGKFEHELLFRLQVNL